MLFTIWWETKVEPARKVYLVLTVNRTGRGFAVAGSTIS